MSSSSLYQVQLGLLELVSLLFKNQAEGFYDAGCKPMLREIGICLSIFYRGKMCLSVLAVD